jgi:membrane protease YdiL (CAAX protease family)
LIGFDRSTIQLAGTAWLAFILWFITFYLTWSTFWIKISVSAALLAVLSVVLQSYPNIQIGFNRKAIIIGVISAVLLYGIFYFGKTVSNVLLPFSGEQIEGIYNKRMGTPDWSIALLLFFITGPAEELYWRGYLQKTLMKIFGNLPGWALSTIIYSGVHIWSFNFMLIGAAAVAGAFWGAIYWRYKTLAPVIISHSIWSTAIFTFFPMN